MKLYYTVTSKQDDPQAKSSLSLGGYKSYNEVTNATIGNLFPDISMYTVKNKITKYYVGVMLKNDSAVTTYDVKLWVEYNTGCVSIVKAAVLDLVADDNGEMFMERIANNSTKPLYATFYECEDEANAIDIGDMLAGELVGVWFEREIDIDTISTQQNEIYTRDPNDPYHYLPVELDTEDNVEIHIGYNLAPVIDSISDKTADISVELSFTATAYDPDGGLVFSLDAASLAEGMTITDDGDFAWTPDVGNADNDYEVTVTVTDTEGLTDSTIFTITVNPA